MFRSLAMPLASTQPTGATGAPTNAAPEPVDFPLLFAGGCTIACAAVAVALGAYLVTRPAPDPAGAAVAVPAVFTRAESPPVRIAFRALTGDAGDLNEPIVLSWRRADGSLAPAERPAVLYARFVSPDASRSDGGLIRRRFRNGTPYEGEDLFVAPPDGRGFWARCPSAQVEGDSSGRCLSEMRVGGRDVQLRFAPALLSRWELLAGAVRRQFASPAT
jgi:hypothetical protein